MTKAEKMAERWIGEWITIQHETPLSAAVDTVEELIHRVAKRTRQEALQAYYDCPEGEDPDLAIRNAQWEDEKV